MVVVSTGALKRVIFAGVSATVLVVATEVILSSKNFLLFLSTAAVYSFVVLTPIINHVIRFAETAAKENTASVCTMQCQ